MNALLSSCRHFLPECNASKMNDRTCADWRARPPPLGLLIHHAARHIKRQSRGLLTNVDPFQQPGRAPAWVNIGQSPEPGVVPVPPPCTKYTGRRHRGLHIHMLCLMGLSPLIKQSHERLYNKVLCLQFEHMPCLMMVSPLIMWGVVWRAAWEALQ
jgi:hypothetical protein